MEFFSLRHRRVIEVPDDAVAGQVIHRETKAGGQQVRYLLTAEVQVDGRPVRLSRFVSREEFEARVGAQR